MIFRIYDEKGKGIDQHFTESQVTRACMILRAMVKFRNEIETQARLFSSLMGAEIEEYGEALFALDKGLGPDSNVDFVQVLKDFLRRIVVYPEARDGGGE